MSELSVEKMFSETYCFFLLLKVPLGFCLLPGNLFCLFAVFPSYIFLLTVTFFRDLSELCFQWLMFAGITGVKFLLIPFKIAFWNPRDFNIIINTITCIEKISSVCSNMNYSSVHTSLTQTCHLLLALQSICETYSH